MVGVWTLRAATRSERIRVAGRRKRKLHLRQDVEARLRLVVRLARAHLHVTEEPVWLYGGESGERERGSGDRRPHGRYARVLHTALLHTDFCISRLIAFGRVSAAQHHGAHTVSLADAAAAGTSTADPPPACSRATTPLPRWRLRCTRPPRRSPSIFRRRRHHSGPSRLARGRLARRAARRARQRRAEMPDDGGRARSSTHVLAAARRRHPALHRRARRARNLIRKAVSRLRIARSLQRLSSARRTPRASPSRSSARARWWRRRRSSCCARPITSSTPRLSASSATPRPRPAPTRPLSSRATSSIRGSLPPTAVRVGLAPRCRRRRGARRVRHRPPPRVARRRRRAGLYRCRAAVFSRLIELHSRGKYFGVAQAMQLWPTTASSARRSPRAAHGLPSRREISWNRRFRPCAPPIRAARNSRGGCAWHEPTRSPRICTARRSARLRRCGGARPATAASRQSNGSCSRCRRRYRRRSAPLPRRRRPRRATCSCRLAPPPLPRPRRPRAGWRRRCCRSRARRRHRPSTATPSPPPWRSSATQPCRSRSTWLRSSGGRCTTSLSMPPALRSSHPDLRSRLLLAVPRPDSPSKRRKRGGSPPPLAEWPTLPGNIERVDLSEVVEDIALPGLASPTTPKARLTVHKRVRQWGTRCSRRL